MRKKLITLLLAYVLVFAGSINVFAAGGDYIEPEEIKTIPASEIDNQIVSTIEAFFAYYYDSLALQSPNGFEDICDNNDNTALYKSLIDYEAEAKTIAHVAIMPNYDVDLVYLDYQSGKDTVSVTLNANVELQYQEAEQGNTSEIHNTRYTFSMSSSDLGWKITRIDTDNVLFSNTINRLGVKARQSSANIETRLQNELDLIKKQLIEEQAVTGSSETDLQILADEDKNEISLMASSYTFSTTRAINWAKNQYNANPGYFVRLSENCQNFVSACVWAGYGGAIAGSGNINSNILNDVRMVSGSTGWYSCPPGYSAYTANWTGVNSFYTYVTGSKTVGPVGTGYNNGNIYTSLAATSLALGDIVQLRNGISGNYTHSVIVTKKDSGLLATEYNKVYVTSSTSDYVDSPLKSYFIDYFGGSNCYMRSLRMSSANFDS